MADSSNILHSELNFLEKKNPKFLTRNVLENDLAVGTYFPYKHCSKRMGDRGAFLTKT